MQNTYEKSCIKIGSITVALAIIANYIPMFYLYVIKGYALDFSTITAIFGLAFAFQCVSWVMQPITYYPTMGIAGTYIGWTVGSVADLRGPAATMAQKAAGVEAGTPSGDVMSTIGITCSVFVSVTIVTIFTFVGAAIINILPAAVVTSFTYILPSVFGAVYANMSLKHLDMGLGTIAVSLVLIFVLRAVGVNNGIITFLTVIVGMMSGVTCFKLRQKKAEK